MAWFVRDIWHKYHSWYFKIVSNFTRLTASEITYNLPNITTNHASTCTDYSSNLVLCDTKLTWKAYATKHEWKINVWGCVEILPSIIQRRDGKHLPCKQRVHFRGVSCRVKKRPLLTTVQFSIVHAWNLSPDLQAKLIVRSVVKWRPRD